MEELLGNPPEKLSVLNRLPRCLVMPIAIRFASMPKTAPINMRVEPSQHALLTKAAAVLNKDRSTFILEAACREAQEVLLDRRLFQLGEEDYNSFLDALDTPPAENSALRALLTEPAPWEK